MKITLTVTALLLGNLAWVGGPSSMASPTISAFAEARAGTSVSGMEAALRLPLSQHRPLYLDWSLDARVGRMRDALQPGQRHVAYASMDMGVGLRYGRRWQTFVQAGFDLWEGLWNDLLRQNNGNDAIDVDWYLRAGMVMPLTKRLGLGLYRRYNHITGERIQSSTAVYPGLFLAWHP